MRLPLSVRTKKERLHKLLKSIPPPDFFRMIWSLRALQSGNPRGAAQLISFPSEAATSDITSKFAIHPWELEDLVNEFFSLNPERTCGIRKDKLLNWKDFNTSSIVINKLRDVQNSEHSTVLATERVRDEMPKNVIKQFDWQRGYFNAAKMYKAWFLFGGDEAKSAFEREHGLSIEKFVMFGFCAQNVYSANPTAKRKIDASELGIGDDEVEAANKLLSIPLSDCVSKIRDATKTHQLSVYRPSIYRNRPLVALKEDSEHLICPIPQLLSWRITDGLYYDLVGLGNRVRNEIGEKFEKYCVAYASAVLPNATVKPAIDYRYGQNLVSSPDFLIEQNNECVLIGECKFKRMPLHEIMQRPGQDHTVRGIDELVKGVTQIWRFRSHVRRGLVPNFVIASDAVGLIVTMDPWLVMAPKRWNEIKLQAVQMIRGKDPNVQDEDMCAVAFCDINDFEDLMSRCTMSSLIDTISKADSFDYSGWHLSVLARESGPKDVEKRLFPFKEKLDEVVSWWSDPRFEY